MIELGELEAAHEEFAKQSAKVVVISLEDRKTAEDTREDFPHLLVVADDQRKLCEALNVIHPGSAPDGCDTAAPTTIIVDPKGTVSWIFRADRFLRRLSPAEVLAALD